MNELYDVHFISNEAVFKDDCGTNFTTQDIEDAILQNRTCLPRDGPLHGYHPYHQHVNPFQVVRYDKGTEQGYPAYGDNIARVCEWRDVIPASACITIRVV